MKLRIGDLVTIKEEDMKVQRGFVTAIHRGYISQGCVDVAIKGEDLGTIINKKSIIGVVPREQVKEYWKHI